MELKLFEEYAKLGRFHLVGFNDAVTAILQSSFRKRFILLELSRLGN